jgi:hypothetical protein
MAPWSEKDPLNRNGGRHLGEACFGAKHVLECLAERNVDIGLGCGTPEI